MRIGNAFQRDLGLLTRPPQVDRARAFGEHESFIEHAKTFGCYPIRFLGADDETAIDASLSHPTRTQRKSLDERAGISYQGVVHRYIPEHRCQVAAGRVENRFREEQGA